MYLRDMIEQKNEHGHKMLISYFIPVFIIILITIGVCLFSMPITHDFTKNFLSPGLFLGLLLIYTLAPKITISLNLNFPSLNSETIGDCFYIGLAITFIIFIVYLLGGEFGLNRTRRGIKKYRPTGITNITTYILKKDIDQNFQEFIKIICPPLHQYASLDCEEKLFIKDKQTQFNNYKLTYTIIRRKGTQTGTLGKFSTLRLPGTEESTIFFYNKQNNLKLLHPSGGYTEIKTINKTINKSFEILQFSSEKANNTTQLKTTTLKLIKELNNLNNNCSFLLKNKYCYVIWPNYKFIDKKAVETDINELEKIKAHIKSIEKRNEHGS